MKRFYVLPILMLLGLPGLSVTTLSAQDLPPEPPPQPVDSFDLVFEREAFAYPVYERKNPFLPLVAGDESGPRFEEIKLSGILFSSNPERSIAMFGLRTGQAQNQADEGVRSRSYGVRRGDRVGNVRVLEIQPTRVVVLVEEFGLTEQRILELPRPGEGGL
jgi:hypothetical protein